MKQDDERREYVLYRLGRARETLKEARLLVDAEYWNAAANRIYYACFYAASALLVAHGFLPKTHAGVRSLFSQHFVKPGQFPPDLASFYSDIFDYRLTTDYGDFVNAEPGRVLPSLGQAEQFVDTISALIDAQ